MEEGSDGISAERDHFRLIEGHDMIIDNGLNVLLIHREDSVTIEREDVRLDDRIDVFMIEG